MFISSYERELNFLKYARSLTAPLLVTKCMKVAATPDASVDAFVP